MAFYNGYMICSQLFTTRQYVDEECKVLKISLIMILNRHECAYAFIVNVSRIFRDIRTYSIDFHQLPFISSSIISFKVVYWRKIMIERQFSELLYCFVFLCIFNIHFDLVEEKMSYFLISYLKIFYYYILYNLVTTKLKFLKGYVDEMGSAIGNYRCFFQIIIFLTI